MLELICFSPEIADLSVLHIRSLAGMAQPPRLLDSASLVEAEDSLLLSQLSQLFLLTFEVLEQILVGLLQSFEVL